jgi:prepilin-type N-terminal cleavage/methylation domain-containing protein
VEQLLGELMLKKQFCFIKNRINTAHGFTLIELLVVISLMAMISIPIGTSLIFGVNVFKSETEVDHIFKDQQFAFNHMKETLRIHPQTVKLVNTSGTTELVIGENADTASIYFLENQSLIFKKGTQEIVLCDHVKTFTLTTNSVNLDESINQLNIVLISSFNNREHKLSSNFSLRRY